MSDLYLYVYDLSKGMARQFSAMFLGKHFDGVWHTGVVAFGQEWYFGNDGISSCNPKGTVLGEPNEILHLGRTEMSEDDFTQVIIQFSETTFKVGSYNLLDHNCNNFSNELSKAIVGKSIPQHIIDLPKEILNTSLGPMLRPLLEQAADPVHMHATGQAQSFLKKMSTNVNDSNQTTSSTTSNLKVSKAEIPVSVIQFKPIYIEDEINSLIDHCQQTNLLKMNDYNLLVETKEYLQQTDIKWSINNSHIRVLLDLYLTSSIDFSHRLCILKIFQTVSLKQEIAELISKNAKLSNELIDSIKISNEHDIKYHALQMLSNLCAHKSVSLNMIEKNQDKLFKELSDFTLIEDASDIHTLIHESSISFFFNLVSAYHLENHLNDSNALSLGVALLERLPKLKSKPKTIYQMLSLLRSCLSKSEQMRELALSMDFDMSRYQQVITESAFSDSNDKSETSDSSSKHFSKSDEYNSIVSNINQLIHTEEHGEIDLKK